MRTTAGSLALKDHTAPEDAFLVAKLREAGAVILGKTNLSEWANFRGDNSSSGWSSLGGQTRNPYDPARNPCGSSSGSAVAVAANLTSVAVGTETNGSVVCPSGATGVVGIKPSLGLISRSGIIPIAHSQDTAGPMGRTVRDAAILLGAMTGSRQRKILCLPPTRQRRSTTRATSLPMAWRVNASACYAIIMAPANHPAVERVFTASIEAIKAQGAIVIDDINPETEGMGDASGTVLNYEFKADLAAYFERSGAPFATLADIIAFNDAHADAVMPILRPGTNARQLRSPAPSKTRSTSKRWQAANKFRRLHIDDVFAEHDLDVLIAPTNSPAWLTDHINGDSFHVSSSSLAAISGYPNVTVPAGFVTGLPVGLSFIGRMNSDKAVIEIAYAFEQATRVRKAPEF